MLITWSVYQRLIAAYSQPDRRRAKTMMTTLIDSLRHGLPDGLEELAQLGRTLWRRRADVLAYFDHHASNGPTEAINGPGPRCTANTTLARTGTEPRAPRRPSTPRFDKSPAYR